RLSALGTAAGVAALTRRGRVAGIVGGATVAALIADDASNALRLARRWRGEEQTTWNVVAEAGDSDAARTLVVIAHHDAPPSGRAFDPTLQRMLGEAFPGIVERIDTSIPQWWGVFGSPALAAVGAATGRRGLIAAGIVLSALATA